MCGAPHPVVMESYDKAAAAKLKAAASSGAQDEEAMVAAPSPQGVSVRTLLLAAKFAGGLSTAAAKKRQEAAAAALAKAKARAKATALAAGGRASKRTEARPAGSGDKSPVDGGAPQPPQPEKPMTSAEALLALTLLSDEELRAKATHRIERSRESELNLSRLGLGSADVPSIVAGLARNRVLCNLSLDRNELGDDGIANVCTAIAASAPLRTTLTGAWARGSGAATWVAWSVLTYASWSHSPPLQPSTLDTTA